MSRAGLVTATLVALGSAGCMAHPGPAAPAAVVVDSLEFSIGIPAIAEHGRPVPLRVTVRNLSSGTHPFEHEAYGPQGETESLDVLVVKPSGEYVWSLRLQNGRLYSGTIHEQLGGGERRVFTAVWDQRDTAGVAVPAGDYLVSATFNYAPSAPPESHAPSIVRLLPRPLRIVP